MTPEAPTIAETVDQIQAALRGHIKATYHVGHPAVICKRRHRLTREGVLFRQTFITDMLWMSEGEATSGV